MHASPLRGRLAAKIAAWSAVGVLGLAAGAAAGGLPSAGPSRPATVALSAASPTASPAATTGRRHRPGQLLGRRTLHGEFVVRGKADAPVTLDVQRGTPSRISADSITVTSTDGYTETYTVTSQTKIRTGKGQPIALTSLPSGAHVAVLAVRTGDVRTARWIRVLLPAAGSGA